MTRVLDWLGTQPGYLAERWTAAGAEDARQRRPLPARWLARTNRISAGNQRPEYGLRGGLLLICGDVIRPGISWLPGSASLQNLTAEVARRHDSVTKRVPKSNR